MKKRSLLLTLAAFGLLASCTAPGGSGASSIPPTDSSQPATTSQQGGTSTPASEPAQSSVPAQESVFADVKDSPRNACSHEKFVQFYNRVIKGLNDSGIYGTYKIEELTLDDFEAALSEFRNNAPEIVNLFEDALKWNHLTDEEVNAILDAYVYGMKMSRSNGLWYDQANYTYFLNVLKGVDLDHLFKTILDLHGNGWSYQRIASLFTMIGGYHGSADSRFGVSTFLKLIAGRGLTDKRVEDYMKAKNARAEAERQRTADSIVNTALTFLNDDNFQLAFATLRLAKGIVLSLDENVGYDGFIKVYNLFFRLSNAGRGGIIAPTVSEILEGVHLLGKAIDTLPLTGKDLDRILGIAYDNLLASFEVNAKNAGNYLKNQYDGMKALFAEIKEKLSGDGILGLLHFVGTLGENFTQGQYESILDLIQKIQTEAEGAPEAIAVLADAIVAAYGKLDEAEKKGLNDIASYFNLDLGALVSELPSWAGLTFQQIMEKAMAYLNPAIAKISSLKFSPEYSLSAYLYVKQGEAIDAKEILKNLDGLYFALYRFDASRGYYVNLPVTDIEFKTKLDSSKIGYQTLEAVIKTADASLDAYLTVEVQDPALFDIQQEMMVLQESSWGGVSYYFDQFEHADLLKQYFDYDSTAFTEYIRANVLYGDGSGTIYVSADLEKEFVPAEGDPFTVDFSTLHPSFASYLIYDDVTLGKLQEWAKLERTGINWSYDYRYYDGSVDEMKTVNTYIFFDVRLMD